MDTLNRILDLLKAKGKSQKELAEILGLGKQSISERKSGKSVSYKKYISEIAQFLDTTPSYLLGSENEEISDDDRVKFALFGTTEVNDEIYEQVKQFAKFAFKGNKED